MGYVLIANGLDWELKSEAKQFEIRTNRCLLSKLSIMGLYQTIWNKIFNKSRFQIVLESFNLTLKAAPQKTSGIEMSFNPNPKQFLAIYILRLKLQIPTISNGYWKTMD